MANYGTQASLERAVGGADVLVQLLDKDGDGIADASLVQEILDRGDAEVNSALEGIVALPLTTVPPGVTFAAVDVYAWLAWSYGARGQTMPPEVEARHANALRWLGDVHDRRRSLGATTRPTTGMQVQQVERSTDDRPRFTWGTSKGFVW